MPYLYDTPKPSSAGRCVYSYPQSCTECPGNPIKQSRAKVSYFCSLFSSDDDHCSRRLIFFVVVVPEFSSPSSFCTDGLLSGSTAPYGLSFGCLLYLLLLSSHLHYFWLFVVSSVSSVSSRHDLAELSYGLNVPLFSWLSPAHLLRMPLSVSASWKLSPDNSFLSGPPAHILIALSTFCWFVCVSPVCASPLCRHPSVLYFSV